ncbi:MAG TPA: BadF/BadG/BcrA/BcrD ATPase family protein [Candidatus Limnocylindrales bacterium]
MGQRTGVTGAANREPLVLGIDGGNSKVDLALVDARGRLLGAVRGPTVSHQAVGLDAGMARLGELAARLMKVSGAVSKPDIVVGTLAGADYPEDVRLLERAITRLELGRDVVVLNDTFAALRAGASSGWGVGLVCGQGINAAAVAPNGRQARFPGIGDIAGDWGGGGGIAMAALQAAVRGSDGRGPHTSLEQAVPQYFGLKTAAAMTRAFYFGLIPESRISSLAPLVFEQAAARDAVARAIIDRLADELAGMAGALIRRLHLTRLDVEVVLAGGVFRTRDEAFYERLHQGLLGAAPRARFVHLDSPPVAGAVLLALDELARRGACPSVTTDESQSLRRALGAWDQGKQ